MNVLFDMFYYISSVTDMFVQAADYIHCAAQDLNKSKEEVKALEKKITTCHLFISTGRYDSFNTVEVNFL